jgi:hypothetical protein
VEVGLNIGTPVEWAIPKSSPRAMGAGLGSSTGVERWGEV